MTRFNRPALYACLSTAAVLAWQALTVHFNYQNDWSALFYTGAYVAVPPSIDWEGTYRISGDPGFDGQFYHFVAHDPFLRGDTQRFVDNPRLRWRRILVPLAAYALAFGQAPYIDSTYAIVVLAFVFAGSYWLSRYLDLQSLPPEYGILFPIIPAVLVSIDRFTTDVALAALCVGFALYAAERRHLPLIAVLALAPLARETGMALVVAYLIYCAIHRSWKNLWLAGLAVVPYAVWVLYLSSVTPSDFTVFATPIPFRGLFERVLHPIQYPTTSAWTRIAAVLDYVGVIGICISAGLTIALAAKRRFDLLALGAMVFCAGMIFVSQPQAWAESYAFARTMCPLAILLGLIGLNRKKWCYLLPLALTVPRIVFQLQPQWKGILRGLKAMIV